MSYLSNYWEIKDNSCTIYYCLLKHNLKEGEKIEFCVKIKLSVVLLV